MIPMVTDEFKERIEARIRDFEQRTCVEFVPVIVRSSGDYSGIKAFAALMVFGLALCIFPYVPTPDWAQDMNVLAALLLSAVAFLLLSWPPLLHLVASQKHLRAEVERGASLSFLREEVFNTRRRSGLLIYISIFEKSVFILADKGITAVVRPKEWAELGARLAKDLSRDNPGVTFLEALDEVVAKLSDKFPPDPDNLNELPDRLRQ